jgi:hypothetical protein
MSNSIIFILTIPNCFNTKNFFMKPVCHKIFCSLSFILIFSIAGQSQQDEKVRIIMIGAHPDDCDDDGGGTAALFAQMGYAVKFVAVTNGDAGHQLIGGPELAKRRLAEAKRLEKDLA